VCVTRSAYPVLSKCTQVANANFGLGEHVKFWGQKIATDEHSFEIAANSAYDVAHWGCTSCYNQ